MIEILTVDTDKGLLTKGLPAFMDGRDVDAQPPLTVVEIFIWDSRRTEIICQLTHGTRVDILDIAFNESEARHYFLVKSGDCQGWIPGAFLSNRRNELIGDKI